MPGNEAQKALLSKLKDRTGIVGRGGSFDVPDSICRGGPAGIQQRVMAEGFGMGPGGAAIREEYASEVLDRARATLGLWDFIQWTEADSIEYIVPVSYEVSRISGSRWGGLTSRWGTGEATVPIRPTAKSARSRCGIGD